MTDYINALDWLNDIMLDEDDMHSDSSSTVASQQSIKAYADNMGSATLSSAQSYADGRDSVTLSTAQAYADSLHSGFSYVIAGLTIGQAAFNQTGWLKVGYRDSITGGVDTNSEFSSSSIFTPAATGTFEIVASVRMGGITLNTGDSIQLRVSPSVGKKYILNTFTNNTAATMSSKVFQLSGSCLCKLTVPETLTVEVQHSASTQSYTIGTAAEQTYLQIRKLV